MTKFLRDILNRFLNKISLSLNGHNHEVSTPRVQSYLILIPILLIMVGALTIEFWAFLHAMRHDVQYKMSNEFIIVFGMSLSHHLAVLFSRNKVNKDKDDDDDDIDDNDK